LVSSRIDAVGIFSGLEETDDEDFIRTNWYVDGGEDSRRW
jgi:hypothetical protein